MTTIEPSACDLCDKPKRSHSQEWTREHGYHWYVAPDNKKILARMLARRAGKR